MSSKIVEDSAFCKQFVMYHIKSINSVTATVREVMVKNDLLTDIRYYLLIYYAGWSKKVAPLTYFVR